jgi:hypothetical protein
VHISEIGLFPIFVPEGKPRNRDMRLKKKRLDALNAMHKTLALNKQLFLKNQEKPPKNYIFFTKFASNAIFWRFFLIFSETVLCKELGFFALHSVHQD